MAIDIKKLESNPDLQMLMGTVKSPLEAAIQERESKLKKEGGPEMTRIANLILQMDARAISQDPEKESEVREMSRKKLAASLGCTADDLQGIVEGYGESWAEKVLEERIRAGISATEARDVSWDRLESAALGKLLILVDSNKVGTVQELLAIAQAGNRANRGNRPTGTPVPAQAGNSYQQNVFLPGSPENGVLPAGHLGSITLSLSPRVMKQIEGDMAVEIGAESKTMRKLDSIEMLDLKAVQEAVQATEKQS